MTTTPLTLFPDAVAVGAPSTLIHVYECPACRCRWEQDAPDAPLCSMCGVFRGRVVTGVEVDRYWEAGA